MSNTLQLLERVRSALPAVRKDRASNYAICKALNVQPVQLGRWLDGKGYPGNQTAFRIAELLQLDAKDVIALIEEDRAETADARAYWRSLCSTGLREALNAATKTAAAVLLTLAVYGYSDSSQAGVSFDATRYTLCALLWRWLAGIAGVLRCRMDPRLNTARLDRANRQTPAPRIVTIHPLYAHRRCRLQLGMSSG